MADFIVIDGSSMFGSIVSTLSWIPTIFKHIGVVKSTSELKRNRPDLWREIAQQGEVIRIGRHVLRLYHVNHIIEVNSKEENIFKIVTVYLEETKQTLRCLVASPRIEWTSGS